VTTQEAGLAGNQDLNTFVELNDVLYFSPTGLNRLTARRYRRLAQTLFIRVILRHLQMREEALRISLADDGVHGMELWKSNWTGDASIVKDINTSGTSNPTQFKMYNGSYISRPMMESMASSCGKAMETEAGTVFLGDLAPGAIRNRIR